MSDNPYPCHVHITSRCRRWQFNFKEVWQYRDLILLFTRRDLSVIYKQTLLGPLWLLLNPLLSSLVYGLVFGKIAGLSTEGIPMVLFYLCGTGAWSFFANCLTKNAGCFCNNAHVFGKVYFPRLTVPVAQVLSALCQYLIQFLLVFCLIIFYSLEGNLSPNWHCWLLIPGVLLQLGLLGLGLGLILSSITAKYRDLNHLINLGVQLWMYITPVLSLTFRKTPKPIRLGWGNSGDIPGWKM